MLSEVREAIGIVISENDNAGISRLEWIEGINTYFDEKEKRESRYENWDDYLDTIQSGDYTYGTVEIVPAYDSGSDWAHLKVVELTREEMITAVRAIRDTYL